MQTYQMRGMADVADNYGGGYLDITTRGNLQVREIMPKNCIPTLTKLSEIGMTSKGAGADNIRNVTASPTSGYDPTEMIDVLPYAKAMHHCILNNRDLYDCPCSIFLLTLEVLCQYAPTPMTSHSTLVK